MSAFMHEVVARIRAISYAPKTSKGAHRCDACHAAKPPHAAKSRRWVIAGLR